jgi:hypothetical protein
MWFLIARELPQSISPSNINELPQKHVAILFMLGELEGAEIHLWAQLDEENK